MNNLGRMICEALGLDPNEVANITISVSPPGEVGLVTVGLYLREGMKLCDGLKRYELKLKEPEEQPAYSGGRQRSGGGRRIDADYTPSVGQMDDALP